MAKKDWLLGDSPNPLGERVAEIREKLKTKKPERLAAKTGSIYNPLENETGEFKLPFWSREVVLRFPDFTGKYIESGEEVNTFDMTMLA